MRRRPGRGYALKYQKHLNHLILNSTFASTREMNEVLAREKAQMPPDKLARLNQLEQAGLFDKGALGNTAAIQMSTDTRLGRGYFPFLYGARPDANYDPPQGNAPSNWELYAKCGVPTASSSSTAISNQSSGSTASLPSTSPR